MSGLFSSLRTTAGTLDALQRSMSVAQNNVLNASTPGYARQSIGMRALEFDPAGGLTGGAVAGRLISSRSETAEVAVRTGVTDQEFAKESASSLERIEAAFDISGQFGIAAKLDAMFSTFSAWAVSPNSNSAKSNVLAAASEVASAFQSAAGVLEDTAARAERLTQTTLADINAVAEKIRLFNVDRRRGATADAGVEANLANALEELSALTGFQTLWQEDGTVTVLAGNEVPLVVGDHRYELSVAMEPPADDALVKDALPRMRIVDQNGVDVTGAVARGRLGALLHVRNETVPKYLGTASTPGELNRLAETVADRVNNILASGYPPPDEPFDLFVFGSSAASIAHTIRVNPAMAPALLQATDFTTDPPSANGVPRRLATLSRPSEAADLIDGLGFAAFTGKIAADAGRDLAAAKHETGAAALRLTQARNLRAEVAGVSLDQEAAQLMELQRAYQAAARMVSVLDEMAEAVINLGRG